jgi:hypothetical protein
MINPLKMRQISHIQELHEEIKILCIMKLTAYKIQGMLLPFRPELRVFAV